MLSFKAWISINENLSPCTSRKLRWIIHGIHAKSEQESNSMEFIKACLAARKSRLFSYS